jgi:hypothetical protein
VSELNAANGVTLNGFNIPGVSTRRTETTVELGSGQSFMIGGLLRNNYSTGVEKAPFLGDVPILGALFRSKSFRKDETELVIVVTPYLVKPVNAGEIALPTDGFRQSNDSQRIFMDQRDDSRTGEQRPGPTKAPPVTVTPGVTQVGSAAPARSLPVPTRAPVQQISVSAATPAPVPAGPCPSHREADSGATEPAHAGTGLHLLMRARTKGLLVMNRSLSSAALTVLALGTAACGPETNRLTPISNPSIYSVNQPVVEHTNYVFDVNYAPGGIPVYDQGRLAQWFQSLELGYGDRVYVQDGGISAAREDVARIAGDYGVLLSEGAPVTAGPVVAGGRSRDRHPRRGFGAGLPDLGERDGRRARATSTNYGCATNQNLARMIADPNDLVRGQDGAARAIRSWAPRRSRPGATSSPAPAARTSKRGEAI